MNKDDKRNVDEFHKELQDADKEKISQYLKIFDRVLLYNIAASVLPAEGIQHVISTWEKITKQAINIDASSRTLFMEGSKLGRIARYREEPDGEEIRLHCLEQLALAKKVVTSNLSGEDGQGTTEF